MDIKVSCSYEFARQRDVINVDNWNQCKCPIILKIHSLLNRLFLPVSLKSTHSKHVMTDLIIKMAKYCVVAKEPPLHHLSVYFWKGRLFLYALLMQYVNAASFIITINCHTLSLLIFISTNPKTTRFILFPLSYYVPFHSCWCDLYSLYPHQSYFLMCY